MFGGTPKVENTRRDGGIDVLVGDEQVVQLREGMHFFTAPANINPGEA